MPTDPRETVAPIGYDAAFAAAIGGYPKGSMLTSAIFFGFWVSEIDHNKTNPDVDGLSWKFGRNSSAT